MFDHSHYVPILRAHAGEWGALGRLTPEDRESMTPLIVVLPKTLTKGDQITITRLAKDIKWAWCGKALFVDFGFVDNINYHISGQHPLLALWNACQTLCPPLSPKLIPVTSLMPSSALIKAIKTIAAKQEFGEVGQGICLRLCGRDIQDNALKQKIEQLLNALAIPVQQVHLVVDFQYITTTTLPTYWESCTKIPYLPLWQTFTLAAGTMPKNLGDFKAREEHKHDRHEWRLWREYVTVSGVLSRQPAFGDYAIIHPMIDLTEKLNTPSASLRYTTPDYFIIMRGVKPNPKNEGFQQYPAHAQGLCDREEFCGNSFSYGDSYAAQKGEDFLANPNNVKNTGNATTWLKAMINHHLVLTKHQIASLNVPSIVGAP